MKEDRPKSLLDWYTRYHALKQELLERGMSPPGAIQAAHAMMEGKSGNLSLVTK